MGTAHEARVLTTVVTPTPLPRVPTGNSGLDEVLCGGLPKGRTSLFSGGPGCGKSILALEFLVRGAEDGKPGIFVPFEERVDAVRANALTLGWDLAELERAGRLAVIDARIDHEMLTSGSFDLRGLLAIIEGASREIGAERLALDAIDVLLRFFNDSAREREQLFFLNDWLLDHGLTTVLTVKRSDASDGTGRYEFLDYLADCVIHLDQRVTEQVATRRLRVIKYRGSNYGRNEYPYVTAHGGVRVIPISGAELRHKPLGKPITSGHEAIDEMLGGGYRQGSCVLIAGASGTGKTTLVSMFICSACKRGDRVLFVGFEESVEALISAMLSSGNDLRPALKSNGLRAMTAMPEAMGVEEHLIRISDAVDQFHAQHLILDAMSAVRRMGSDRAAFDFLVRLVSLCRANGLTLLFTNQTTGSEQMGEIAGEEASSLVDTILHLRYIEVGGETNRLIGVIKSRGMQHSNQLREFRITEHGVEVSNIYAGLGGVLTGAARQEKEEQDAIDLRRAAAAVEAKKSEIMRRRAELEAETGRLSAAMQQAEIELKQLEIEVRKTKEGRFARSTMRLGKQREVNGSSKPDSE